MNIFLINISDIWRAFCVKTKQLGDVLCNSTVFEDKLTTYTNFKLQQQQKKKIYWLVSKALDRSKNKATKFSSESMALVQLFKTEKEAVAMSFMIFPQKPNCKIWFYGVKHIVLPCELTL